MPWGSADATVELNSEALCYGDPIPWATGAGAVEPHDLELQFCSPDAPPDPSSPEPMPGATKTEEDEMQGSPSFILLFF